MNIKLKLFFYSVLILLSGVTFLSDTDRDSLPDDWETANGHDPLSADYMVSAGGGHACALDDTGVVCWGSNYDGESDVPPLINPTQVSAGVFLTCATDDTGVVCWGSLEDRVSNPTDMPILVNPTQVSVGKWHACALDDTGVVCWGGNNYGQLDVPELSNPTYVSAGGGGTCAIDNTGVVCWGDDAGLYIVPVLSNPTEVYKSGSGGHYCALDDTGLVCWGNNNYGQTDVPILANPTQASLRRNHTCAVDGGGIACWGYDALNQLYVPTLKNPTQVTIGSNSFKCALDNTGVVCWGYDNENGKTDVPSLMIDPDGDGYSNQAGTDAFPLDATEWLDTDLDGIGNNADTDDDGDGVLDSQDAFPLDNTETSDSDGDGVGENDEERAEVLASELLSQKMIHYLGSLASVFMEDLEDVAGQSGSWSLAIGETVNNSFACIDGGGYNAETTRTDWTKISVTLFLFDCKVDGFTVDNSASFTWEDRSFDQPSPRQDFPMVFSTSDLVITDSVAEIFSYSGSLSCDVAYNSVTESWTRKNEGENIIWEGQWGSVFDPSVGWSNNSLVTNDAGNTDVYVVDGVNNCDFNSVSVVNRSLTHTILDVKYLAQPNGAGYNISEDTRSERLAKAQTKKVFNRDVYTPQAGWISEEWSRHDQKSVVRLSGKGDYNLNVYSSTIPTYFWASRESVGDIIYQEVDQFSELEWVYFNSNTGKLTANNYRFEPNTSFDYNNDGVRDSVNAPWVISRFISNSNSQCNWILRYADWTIVEQGPNGQDRCNFNSGFYVYEGKIWYQDSNLDGINELFTLDDDADGIFDADDNCQAASNPDQLDTDNDSLGNTCDSDDDGDRVLDSSDAFPLDASESMDTDGDGVGNNSDWAPYDSTESADTDDDGVGDNADAFPTDASESLDTDGDGTGDNTDSDIDGDGVSNSNDPFPNQGQYKADSDGDGCRDLTEDLDPNDASDADE